MKTLRLISFVSMLVAPLVSMGQVTTVFNDTFASGNLSTLNPTAASPGTLTSTRTAYEIGSSKNATTTAITTGALTLSTASTGSGYTEGQALFTGTPVTLNTAGQYIEVYYTFTDTANTFNTTGTTGNNMQINVGLYNSGTSGPTNGTLLWSSGLTSSGTTAVNGGAKGWLGYSGQFAYTPSGSSANSSAIVTRPAQTGANNLNQAIGASSGYASGVNLATMTGIAGQPFLTQGNQYTVDLRIYYVNSTTLAITNTLYNGVGTTGTVFSASGWTGKFGGAVTGANLLTSTFDALELGYRPTTSTATTLQINNVTVLLVTPIAPSITGLTNQTVVASTSPALSPTVTGVPTPAYQWYVSTDGGATSNALSYATGSSLTLTNVQYSQNNYIYTLVATNSMGTNVSSMTLSVIVTPSITGLSDQAANVGDTVVINPTVSGIPAPTFQWLTNGVPVTDGLDANGSTIAGSTTSALYITNAQSADSVNYSLVASNSAGVVTNTMHLTVASGNQLPVLTGPTNTTVIQGNNATFTASATGVPVPTLQWFDQTGTPIVGATGNTLVLTNVQYSQDGYIYSVVASNSAGSVTNSATLTVIVPPVITNQPGSLVVTNTQSASFTVGATGVPAVAYQWSKNGSPISTGANATANSATLVIASASPGDIGTYSVTITNAAGTTNSVSVTLTVNSTMAATTFSPANGQTGVCYDTPLYVTFSQTPVLRTNGTIKIFNVTNSTTPVDTINLASNSALGVQSHTAFSGDSQGFSYYPVIITGGTAAIYPHSGVMTSNQTYYVTVDDGAFADTNGAYFSGIAANAFQFSTKVGGPASSTSLVVAQDYSGDFATVQGAVDSISAGNTTPRTINIHNGKYTEIVNISGKHNILLRGQSRSGTIIAYANSSIINPSTHTRMAFKVNANDIALDNLTLTNSTAQDASQAEALMIESGAARVIINNCNIDSYQDTILANISTSKAYFNKTLIQGDVDFIWGGGNLFFTNCEIRYLIRVGNSAAVGPNPSPNSLTDISSNGFSFVNCAFTTLPGANPNDTIGRTRGITNANMAMINCFVSTNIGGWSADASPTNNFRNWYYNCTNDYGSAVTLSNGIPLSAGDPNLTLASSATSWLYGWVPALSPNIIANPSGVSASAGQPASFSVSATGIPDPAYQWLKNGAPVSGATNAVFNLTSAVRSDAANYSVVVSNGSGSVTSSVAALTYTGNVAPVAATATYSRPSGLQLKVALSDLGTNWTDADGDTVTLTGVSSSTNGTTLTYDSNYIYYPATTVADQFTYTVSDGQGGAATGTVNLTLSSSVGITQPITVSGSSVTVNFAGIPNYSYEIQRSTNLSSWITILTTNAPSNGVFKFTDNFTDLGGVPPASAYYRTAQP